MPGNRVGSVHMGLPRQREAAVRVAKPVSVLNLEDFYAAGAALGIGKRTVTVTWRALVRREVLQRTMPDPRSDGRPTSEILKSMPRHSWRDLQDRTRPWPIIFGIVPILDGHAHDLNHFGDLHTRSLGAYVDLIELEACRVGKVHSLDELSGQALHNAEELALQYEAAHGVGHAALALFRHLIEPGLSQNPQT